jgi:hypothetical protein
MTDLSKIVTKTIILLINVTVLPVLAFSDINLYRPVANAEVTNSPLRTQHDEIYGGSFRAQREGAA